MIDYVKTSFFTTGQLKTINKAFIRDKYNSHYALLFNLFIFLSIYLFLRQGLIVAQVGFQLRVTLNLWPLTPFIFQILVL